MAQRPPPPQASFARRVISALQQNICACACSRSRSQCLCWIFPLRKISNPWRQTGIRFISSLISTHHRARVFRDRIASIGGIYYGSLGHADDLRSITASIALLEEQAAAYPGKWPSTKYETIKSFCVNRCLKPLVSSQWLFEIIQSVPVATICLGVT